MTVISGLAFIVGALVFFIVSRNRTGSDIILWSLFVLTHGLHEIFEYLFEVNQATLDPTLFYYAELTEISLFAISAVLLVIASLQRVNKVEPPWTYYLGIALLFPILYFTWLPDKSVFDLVHKSIFIGILETNLHRLLFGLIFGLVPVIVFSFLSINLSRLQSSVKNSLIKTKRNRVILATFAAITFLFFEGFVFEDPNILIIKALAALFILIIPVDILLSKSAGLKSLIVFDASGRMLFGHSFAKSQDTDELAVISGFMSALGTFSQEEIDQGKMKTLQLAQGSLIFSHQANLTAGLLSLTSSSQIENELRNFLSEFIVRFKEPLKHSERYIDLEEFDEATELVIERFIIFS